jgi:hypothetical protein
MKFEEDEELLALMSSESWPVFIKWLYMMQGQYNKRVLQQALTDEKSMVLLAYEKARAEGYNALIRDIENKRKQLRKEIN